MCPGAKDGAVDKAYAQASQQYAQYGVDTETSLKQLSEVAISLHCWQGDDLDGFETPDAALGGGLATTGNYPGKARNAYELRSDLDKAYSLIPLSLYLSISVFTCRKARIRAALRF